MHFRWTCSKFQQISGLATLQKTADNHLEAGKGEPILQEDHQRSLHLCGKPIGQHHLSEADPTTCNPRWQGPSALNAWRLRLKVCHPSRQQEAAHGTARGPDRSLKLQNCSFVAGIYAAFRLQHSTAGLPTRLLTRSWRQLFHYDLHWI